MKHYAIGDVHGEFDTLIELTNQLPKKAKFIFVGDLIDRGPDSSKVVNFVRKGNHQCVLGNHEDMMVREAKRMKKTGRNYDVDKLWAINGGLDTLKSYGIIDVDKNGSITYTRNESNINKFIDDAEWMASLPLYAVTPVKWKSHYDIVVSHAALSDAWPDMIGNEKDEYKTHVLWNKRQEGAVVSTIQILNIFGHTPHEVTTPVSDNGGWINIDSGCTYNRPGLGKLTAINLKTLKTISIDRI